MYPRRLLLEDARQHDIPILPLDANVSEPEYVAEETADGVFGIRLALQDVHGISDAEIRSILQGTRRAAVPRRGGLPAPDDRLPAGDRGARARRGVRPARDPAGGRTRDRTAGPTCTRP